MIRRPLGMVDVMPAYSQTRKKSWDRRPRRSHLYKSVKVGQPPHRNLIWRFGGSLIKVVVKEGGCPYVSHAAFRADYPIGLMRFF